MVVLVDTVSVNQVRPRHPEKVNRPDALSPPKPDWIRVRAPNTRGYADTRKIVKENGLVTVCEEAGCPNIGECWDKKHATFMIMGDTCTRACAFCNVKTGMPGALDVLEPEHVAEATFKLGLAHVVVTSVDRDDLADGGAEHFAQTIRALQPTHGIAVMRRRRGLHDERALCSGPGKLCEALGITMKHSELPLDAPPIALHARIDKPEIVAGVRIGITKAVDLPWRYGLKGSRFLSKPF